MKRILIVEDDLAFGTMIQTWLKKKGFDVRKGNIRRRCHQSDGEPAVHSIWFFPTCACPTMTDWYCSSISESPIPTCLLS